MIEQSSTYDKETHYRLNIANTRLRKRNGSCVIKLLGVMHAEDPRPEILEEISEADVVTLELTRGVVKAGLVGEQTQLLGKNRFWAGILDFLRPRQETKFIRGIEVNQAPRFALKRLDFHNNDYPLDPTVFDGGIAVLELNQSTDSTTILNPEELEKLYKFKWLATQDPDIHNRVMHALNHSLKKKVVNEFGELVLDDSFILRSYKPDETTDQEPIITFTIPPPPQLIDTGLGLYDLFKDIAGITEKDAANLVFTTISTYLHTPVEQSEAREIAYAANQFIYRSNRNDIKVLHIGGAGHTSELTEILMGSLPQLPRFSVQPLLETGLTLDGSVFEFTKEKISIRDRLQAVTVQNHDAYINPELTLAQIKRALSVYQADLVRRLEIEGEVNTLLKRENSSNQSFVQRAQAISDRYKTHRN